MKFQMLAFKHVSKSQLPGSSTRNANARGIHANRRNYALMTGRKNLRQTAPS